MITIVIPTLDEEKYLPNLLRSLEQQTCRDFEVSWPMLIPRTGPGKSPPGMAAGW